MATDARISTALPSHHKTKKLARRLGAAGPLGCIYLFLWVATHRSDGDLTGMTDEDIELAIDWAGEEGAFVMAMMDVGFLEGQAGDRRVHDWAEHNPWAAGAEARSEKSRWAALCKQHGRAEAARQMPEYAQRLAGAPQQTSSSEPEEATGKPDAVPESASGTQQAETGSAPSPSPSRLLSDTSPYPSPSPPPSPGKAPAKARAEPVETLSLGDLVSEGVDQQHGKDWLAVRAKHKAPLTQTAWDGLKAEALKAHITPARAVQICAEKSWRGFDSTWDWPGKPAAPRLAAAGGRHAGFETKDYHAGANADGSF